MGSFSIVHWLIVLAVVLILFGGGGKLSGMMGDLGKGIRALKTNLKGQDSEEDDDGDDGLIDAPAQRVSSKGANSKASSKKPAKKKAPAKKKTSK